MNNLRCNTLIFVLIAVFFVFTLSGQYNNQEDMPGLNPDHSDNLYDEMLEKQGIKKPERQPGTGPNEDYNAHPLPAEHAWEAEEE